MYEFIHEVDLYRKLHKARNELLSGSGYHELNMEKQIAMLKKANAPKEEIKLIEDSWDMQNKLYSTALKDYRFIINSVNDYLNNKPLIKQMHKKSIGDIQQEMGKNARN